jgi:hypothetical protein
VMYHAPKHRPVPDLPCSQVNGVLPFTRSESGFC